LLEIKLDLVAYSVVWIFTSLPGGVQSIAISVYVCLSADMSQKQHDQTSRRFLYVLPVVVVARSFSNDNAMFMYFGFGG